MEKRNILEKYEETKIAFIACAGSAAGKVRFDDYDTCVQAIESGFQMGECSSGCVGVGDCISACTKGAMSLQNGRVVIDRKKCDGCGDCAEQGVCPQGLIRMIPADAVNFIPCSSKEEDEEQVRNICGFGCIGCGECEKACPVDAVSIVLNHAVIDYEKCVGCDACTVVCKRRIIVDTYHKVSGLKSNVAFVHCGGNGKISAVLEAMDIKSCKEAVKLNWEEQKLCTTGCLGLGECTIACQNDAIHVMNGVSRVDPERCVACGECTYACPRHLISIIPYRGQKVIACSATEGDGNSTVCSSGCDLCGRCEMNCLNSAIHIEEGRAVIDSAACNNCHICQYVCPRNVIKEMRVPEYIALQQEAFVGKGDC